jgi:RNase H-fold protein (predicted Holliday junction resolvase)
MVRVRQDRQAKELEVELVNERKAGKQANRKRREENKKRKEENARKAEIVQAVS